MNEELATTSARGETPRHDYLLKFGFGGVQAFISQSRKTRDLAASSRLISHLTRCALDAARPWGRDVILPAKYATACPHQAVLRLRAKTEDQVRECGHAMRQAVADEWLRQAGAALDAHGLVPPLEAQARAQLEDTFDTYWVAIAEDCGYDTAFARLADLFEARRFTRTFRQLPQYDGPHLWTCVQCGARAVVLDRPRGRGFDVRDRLCAACGGKRAWSFIPISWRGSFPSTPALARDRFFRDPRWEEIRQLLGLEDDDWSDLGVAWKHCLALRNRAEIPSPDAPRRDEILRLAAHLAQTVPVERQAEVDAAIKAYERQTPYYVLLCFDGDRMGRWFSGELGIGGQPALEAFQRALSASLARFADRLGREAPFYRTTLVYAGGDDGLALLPVDCLFPFIKAVLAAWNEEVGNQVTGGHGGRPTLSLHASVVHEHHPLSVAVSQLHSRLDETKQLLDGHACSVWTEPRAGSIARLLVRNDELDTVSGIVEALSTWRAADMPPSRPCAISPGAAQIEARRRAALPARLPHKLLAAADGFFDAEGYCPRVDGFELEMRRLTGYGDAASVTEADRRSPHTTGVSAGTRVAGERLAEWLVQRARVPYTSRSGLPEFLPPRQAVVGALAALAFLSRQLDWGQP